MSETISSGLQALRSTTGLASYGLSVDLSLVDVSEPSTLSSNTFASSRRIHSSRSSSQARRRLSCGDGNNSPLETHCMSTKKVTKFTFPTPDSSKKCNSKTSFHRRESFASDSYTCRKLSFTSGTSRSGRSSQTSSACSSPMKCYSAASFNIMTETPDVEGFRQDTLKSHLTQTLAQGANLPFATPSNNPGLSLQMCETPASMTHEMDHWHDRNNFPSPLIEENSPQSMSNLSDDPKSEHSLQATTSFPCDQVCDQSHPPPHHLFLHPSSPTMSSLDSPQTLQTPIFGTVADPDNFNCNNYAFPRAPGCPRISRAARAAQAAAWEADAELERSKQQQQLLQFPSSPLPMDFTLAFPRLDTTAAGAGADGAGAGATLPATQVSTDAKFPHMAGSVASDCDTNSSVQSVLSPRDGSLKQTQTPRSFVSLFGCNPSQTSALTSVNTSTPFSAQSLQSPHDPLASVFPHFSSFASVAPDAAVASDDLMDSFALGSDPKLAQKQDEVQSIDNVFKSKQSLSIISPTTPVSPVMALETAYDDCSECSQECDYSDVCTDCGYDSDPQEAAAAAATTPDLDQNGSKVLTVGEVAKAAAPTHGKDELMTPLSRGRVRLKPIQTKLHLGNGWDRNEPHSAGSSSSVDSVTTPMHYTWFNALIGETAVAGESALHLDARSAATSGYSTPYQPDANCSNYANNLDNCMDRLDTKRMACNAENAEEGQKGREGGEEGEKLVLLQELEKMARHGKDRDECAALLTSNVMRCEREMVDTERKLGRKLANHEFYKFDVKMDASVDKNGIFNMMMGAGEGNHGKEELGGAYGCIEKAFHLRSGMMAALKSSRQAQQHFETYKQFLKEAYILNEFETCEQIVDLLECGKDGDNNCVLALEFMDLLSFRVVIQQNGLKEFKQLQWIAKSVLSALKHLHAWDHLIVHNDVKPENVLISRRGEVKLTDFGCAQRMQKIDGKQVVPLKKVQGSKKYFAPEKLRHFPFQFGVGVDVWAFGVTLYQGVMRLVMDDKNYQTWQKKFDEDDYFDPFGMGDAGNLAQELESLGVAGDVRDFLGKLLHPNANERASAGEMLEHEFVKDAEKTEFRVGKCADKMNDNCGERDLFFMLDSLLDYYSNRTEFDKIGLDSIDCDNKWSDCDKIKNMSRHTGICVDKIEKEMKIAANKFKNQMLRC